MVLRLTVPADDEYSAVAADLAVKVAEHLGRAERDAESAREAVQGLVSDVAPRTAAAGEHTITFEFHRVDHELRIDARCEGRSSQARHPLPT
jgi:hypothetical protein